MSGRNHCFYKTGVVVLVVSWKTITDFIEWEFRQQRDAIERLLAVHGDVVTERLERFARKSIVDAFGFLQADDVRLALGKPCHRGIDALFDRVYVPGGDAHGRSRASQSEAGAAAARRGGLWIVDLE